MCVEDSDLTLATDAFLTQDFPGEGSTQSRRFSASHEHQLGALP